MLSSFLSHFIQIFFQILIFAIFARVILSWMRIAPHGFLFRLLVESTEPILKIFRRIIPPLGGVLDISPILAFLAIDLIRNILLGILA